MIYQLIQGRGRDRGGVLSFLPKESQPYLLKFFYGNTKVGVKNSIQITSVLKIPYFLLFSCVGQIVINVACHA